MAIDNESAKSSIFEGLNMIPQMKCKMTPQEYLEFERSADTKHEYFDGEIFAMTGARPNHNRISFNIAGELKGQLKGSNCMGFTNDQRVKIEAITKYVYPDLSIACDNVEFDDDSPESLLNPVVIFEILSDSTEAYDRGMKFEHYQLIDSLQEYILIAQDRCRVDKYVRNRKDGTWILSTYSDKKQIVKIDAIKCDLPLSEIYDRIELKSC
ncbi:conserved hypothetical protein [Desulfamplus magnetovallimortis]|uniref:Putative restriction endonuclease domain-containing protein n=1 Tax=Desulfamplus magnetovallimortis TaxID=1246637 RepID=A0A1W1HKJ9_9BACT|nr:Uma2 family endonuclease [Desulfamplus magnetovallimortis]SLM32999.1 conserved hypothetical protein [Desulfamplus magnetovallimortis]